MNCTVERLIAIAKNEIGYLEKKTNSQLDDHTANAGENNWTKYARDLYNAGYYNGKNKNGYPWCDVFVDWLFYQLCDKDAEKANEMICQTKTGDRIYGAGCTESRSYYKRDNRLYSAPIPGDQIFFSKNGIDSYHTGIVYAVDNTYVYTIEGNTSSAEGVVENGGCVRNKKYKLNNSKIFGYGRPKYSDSSSTAGMFESFIPEDATGGSAGTEIVLVPRAFSVSFASISATKAIVQLTANNYLNYNWSYSLTDYKANSSIYTNVSINAAEDIQLTGLVPHTLYLLQITAANNLAVISQQVLFATTQDYPGAALGVNTTTSKITSCIEKFKIEFKPPVSWGEYSIHRKKGYRVSLVINGKIVAYSDSLVTQSDSTKVSKAISLLDILDNDIEIDSTSIIQIGIQTWVISEDGEILLNSIYPTTSQPICLSKHLKPIKTLYLRTEKGFKKSLLYSLFKNT